MQAVGPLRLPAKYWLLKEQSLPHKSCALIVTQPNIQLEIKESLCEPCDTRCSCAVIMRTCQMHTMMQSFTSNRAERSKGAKRRRRHERRKPGYFHHWTAQQSAEEVEAHNLIWSRRCCVNLHNTHVSTHACPMNAVRRPCARFHYLGH